MSVQQWRRKPHDTGNDILTVARYEPGKPLASVAEVAKMAPAGRVAVAYLPSPGTPRVELPDTPVLVTAWMDGSGGTQYTVVPAGQYLVWDTRYDGLDSYSEKDLNDWYELVTT